MTFEHALKAAVPEWSKPTRLYQISLSSLYFLIYDVACCEDAAQKRIMGK